MGCSVLFGLFFWVFLVCVFVVFFFGGGVVGLVLDFFKPVLFHAIVLLSSLKQLNKTKVRGNSVINVSSQKLLLKNIYISQLQGCFFVSFNFQL